MIKFTESIEFDMLCGAVGGAFFFLALKLVLSFVA